MGELRARNRALTEDLLSNGGPEGTAGQSSPAASEARATADLRGARAQAEATALRQQLVAVQGT